MVPGNQVNDEFRRKTHEGLTNLGVNMIFEERYAFSEEVATAFKNSEAYYLSGNQQVKTDKGRTFSADLVFFCVGTKINNRSFQQNFTHLLDDEGRIKVNRSFQVEGLNTIFAIGDCCNMENKMAFYAGQHGEHVAKNIQLISQNQRPVDYVPNTQPVMLMTLGRTGGVSLLPGGTILGNFMTGMIKGKDLFTGKTWSQLNQKQGRPIDKEKKSAIKQKNLAAAMVMTPEEAAALVQSVSASAESVSPRPGQDST